LSEVTYSEISGVSNLEWDVIHLSPEFFALWPLNSYKVIASCSEHIVNKSQIPEQEFEKIRRGIDYF
jgi:Zn-dependent oligopeptidase